MVTYLMARSRAVGASPPSVTASKKRPMPVSVDSQRVIRRARQLIEQLLEAMQLGFRDEGYRNGEEWEALFGAKQSMTASLQKLVATFVALPEEVSPADVAQAATADPIMTQQEIELLKSWLEEQARTGAKRQTRTSL